MEKYFGNAYRGDPGVPHADPDRFVNIWIGSAAFSVLTYFNPYMWTLSNQFKPQSDGILLGLPIGWSGLQWTEGVKAHCPI
ncbi:uncharacterized protein HKW66_Vig0237470 [Vigna angularis]|uniref:Uncharacterized protein n=1 Tax=Phaseolus angularis TaxID=3914 RepID=A0A8T0KQV9_PHAAN|nr:uncharacterized protein HKW66_Vig0237470 [Vigna angularis]